MSYITKKVEINGVLDTGKFCLDNLQTIADSSQAYVSWDPIDGLWVANINSKDTTNPNSLERIFSDSNILGPINVTGLGINGLYNVATATFYDERLKGTKDEVRVFIRDQDRLEYEVENTLSLDYALVNDPGQAAYAASVELKTSRLQYSIEFTTDYTEIGIRAGEIIGVRNELYFSGSETTPKKFRVISVEEIDTDEGAIALSITAVEYDDDVYAISGFSIEERNKNTSIIPKEINVEIGREEDVSIGKQIGGLFAAGIIDGIVDSVFSVDPKTGAISQTTLPQGNLETLLDDYATGVLNDLITDFEDGTLNVASELAVQEEGTQIATGATVFNFVGDSITATANGTEITITSTATPDPDGTLVDVINDYEAGTLGGGGGGDDGGVSPGESCSVYIRTGSTNIPYKEGVSIDTNNSLSCNPIYEITKSTTIVSRPFFFIQEPGNYRLKVFSEPPTEIWYQAYRQSQGSLYYDVGNLLGLQVNGGTNLPSLGGAGPGGTYEIDVTIFLFAAETIDVRIGTSMFVNPSVNEDLNLAMVSNLTITPNITKDFPLAKAYTTENIDIIRIYSSSAFVLDGLLESIESNVPMILHSGGNYSKFDLSNNAVIPAFVSDNVFNQIRDGDGYIYKIVDNTPDTTVKYRNFYDFPTDVIEEVKDGITTTLDWKNLIGLTENDTVMTTLCLVPDGSGLLIAVECRSPGPDAIETVPGNGIYIPSPYIYKIDFSTPFDLSTASYNGLVETGVFISYPSDYIYFMNYDPVNNFFYIGYNEYGVPLTTLVKIFKPLNKFAFGFKEYELDPNYNFVGSTSGTERYYLEFSATLSENSPVISVSEGFISQTFLENDLSGPSKYYAGPNSNDYIGVEGDQDEVNLFLTEDFRINGLDEDYKVVFELTDLDNDVTSRYEQFYKFRVVDNPNNPGNL